MGNIISKMGLYDLFAKGVTGAVVLCVADLFGIANILGSGISVWVIIFGGYFLGLVLEELSYLLEILLKSRQKSENKVCAENKYQEYDFEKCKAALLSNEKKLFLTNRLRTLL